MQHDVHPKFTSNLTADGLTSQRCLISLTCYTLYHISVITRPLFSGCLQIVATLPHGMTSVIQREEWYMYLCTSVLTYNSYNNWTSLDSIVSGAVIDGHTQYGKLVFLKDSRLHWYNHAYVHHYSHVFNQDTGLHWHMLYAATHLLMKDGTLSPAKNIT